jgi:hypothetical protein
MEQEKKKISSRGGARPGAGRPKGSKDQVSVRSLMAALEQRSPNTTYEEMFWDDLIKARYSGDQNIIVKYHNLALNKLLATKLEVETHDSEDAIAAKQAAFAAALADITGLNKE